MRTKPILANALMQAFLTGNDCNQGEITIEEAHKRLSVLLNETLDKIGADIAQSIDPERVPE